jgi:two-component system cell cycle response regulator
VTENGAGSQTRPRVLLIGEPSARPEGLERALTRAGFQLVESEEASTGCPADAVLISMKNIESDRLSELLSSPPAPGPMAPRVVITSSNDREGPAKALAIGAADALASPVHLPELCARLRARILERKVQQPSAAPDAPQSGSELEALDCRMRQELERSRRYSLSFSLILLGIEELRAVEERVGRDAAEQLRRDVVSALRRELRLPDFVVTYGANEFAIILPETGQAGARQSVLRVRDRLSVVPSEGDPRLDRPRFTAGIVTYPHPAISQTDEMLALAEAALARGKAQAGERIGIAI